MITILILSITLVLVAAVLLFQAKNRFDQNSAALQGAQLDYRLLNSKLSNELKYWQFRRKIFEEPSILRKKKIRGKKRKTRK